MARLDDVELALRFYLGDPDEFSDFNEALAAVAGEAAPKVDGYRGIHMGKGGLIVPLNDGTEFQVTVTQTK